MSLLNLDPDHGMGVPLFFRLEIPIAQYHYIIICDIDEKGLYIDSSSLRPLSVPTSGYSLGWLMPLFPDVFMGYTEMVVDFRGHSYAWADLPVWLATF